MKRLYIYIALGVSALAIALIGQAYIPKPATPVAVVEKEQPTVTQKPTIGGPFILVDQNGKTVTEADFAGRYMMVFFGYTFCPDVCPTAMQAVTDALDLLGPAGEKIDPVFISIDPERDTPAVMKSFVENFHPRLTGLTGSLEQIADVAKAYKVYFGKVREKDAPEDEYMMNHSSVIYVMGPDGKFVTHFTHGTTPETMAEKLKELVGS